MNLLKQSAAVNVMVFMTDSADHVTGKTGLTLAVTASKNGGAFASVSPTVTERGSGWYNLALTASHTDTLGDLVIHITGTGADPSDLKLLVVAFDVNSATNLGLSYLDAAASTRAAESGGNLAAVKLKTDNLPADPASNTQINTRLATAGYTAPDNAGITAIKAKTDNLPTDPADESMLEAAIATRMAGSAYTAPDNAGIAAIKAKTDNLPSGIRKNATLNNFSFAMTDAATHYSFKTGLAVTAERSIDGGAFASCTNAPAEVGNGVYKINLSAADTNGSVILLKFTAAGADDRMVTIVTEI